MDGAITGDLNGTVVNTVGQPPFIIRGPIVPGNFLGTGTPALFTDDLRGQESFEPGYRITLGYRFDNGTAIETSYMALQKVTYSANASLIPHELCQPGGRAVPGRFVHLGTVLQSAAGIRRGQPEDGARQPRLGLRHLQRRQQHVDELPASSSRTGTFAAGCRGTRTTAPASTVTLAAGSPGSGSSSGCGPFPPTSSATARRTDVGVYRKRRFQPHVRPVRRHRVRTVSSATASASALETEAAFLLDIVKERANVQNGDRNDAPPGTPFVSVKKAATNFQPGRRIRRPTPRCTWYPIEGIQLRAGYNFMTFLNTVDMQDPIAFDARNFDPNWQNRAIRFMDGFNAGIGFIF